ncbi:MAG: response regulator transcription factor [Sneathiella sp.]
MFVLIADRHDLFRQGVVTILKELNSSDLNVRETDSFPKLLEFLNRESFDLVVTSLNILQEEGLLSLKNIRIQHPDIPILVVADNPTVKTTEELRSCDVNGIIGKSASKGQYINAMNSILLGGSHLPPSPSKRRLENTAGKFFFPGTLTRRQEEVLFLISEGKSNKDIAADLRLSEGTIKVHVTAIFKALNVKNRTQAMLFAQKNKQETPHS